MGLRVVATRVIGTALVVLCGLGASGSVADEAISGELGPVRQWVAQRDGVYGSADVPIGLPKPLQAPLLRRSHEREGAIVGAVVLGVLSGWYFGAMGGFACQDYRDRCDDAAWLAAAGAAGGALVGGAVGTLVGSQFETTPSMAVPASRARTRVKLLPRRGGVGIALSHSF
jgi:hypothetical protein